MYRGTPPPREASDSTSTDRSVTIAHLFYLVNVMDLTVTPSCVSATSIRRTRRDLVTCSDIITPYRLRLMVTNTFSPDLHAAVLASHVPAILRPVRLHLDTESVKWRDCRQHVLIHPTCQQYLAALWQCS